ncbi:GNAT family N-acetyltransferase [Erythrobacter sp.]|uniref:GNAT family N-acetyltransferase n=1 Tax=Erythrobacter sp. TaxID=1042 RepID=UPI003C725993
MFNVRRDDLSSAQTRELLILHLAGMQSISPAGSVFALGLSGLQIPEVTVWTAWADEKIAAVGVLKMLDDRSAEIKSMRTHPDFLRRGAASAILEALIANAKDRGSKRLSLETGSGSAFEPAVMLYRRRGFENGAAFGDYAKSDFNQFLHLEL